ncbi:MAG TPA: phosphoribosylglycinamide formyltransferase [Thermoanaerobaculia bacterium]|nr:phosphoribosylglycinamide formyltransferase [Thermoanaerobaculia bacterium]
MSVTAAPGAGELAPVGVLLSGRGSNFLALHAAMERGEVPARVALVVSNVAGAPGLARARELGLDAVALPHRGYADRERHEEAVLAALGAAGVEWVCLAGYMRLLSRHFVEAFPERILNIHPSLLPSFPGLRAQEQALAHGVRVAGCTVHLVDAELDSGPIVVQRAVEVREDDDLAALCGRILAEEHRAYPEALRLLLGRRWRVEGRRLVFTPGA